MKLSQIITADRAAQRLITCLGPLLEPEARDDLQRIASMVSEVRQFAVSWVHARDVEASAGWEDHAAQMREEAITRLVQYCSPE